MAAVAGLPRAGQTRKANLIWKIAREPRSLWLGRFTQPNFFVKVRRLIDPARAQGAVPIFTVLRAQATGCRPTYTGGGPAEDAQDACVVRRPRRAIGARPRGDRVRARLARHDRLPRAEPPRRSPAAAALRGRRRCRGSPTRRSTSRPAHPTGRPPRAPPSSCARSGSRRCSGFMLNATHYDWTRANIRHGLAISRLIGGKHFIINTAENGRGPVHYQRGHGGASTSGATRACADSARRRPRRPRTRRSTPTSGSTGPGYAQSCQGRPIAWYPPRALTYARFATIGRARRAARASAPQALPLSAFVSRSQTRAPGRHRTGIVRCRPQCTVCCGSGSSRWRVVLGACAVVPAALLHFLGPREVHISAEVHFLPIAISAGLAAGAAVALTVVGARRGDGRAVLVGTAFSAMAALLAVHGLTTPGLLADDNGVVAFSGALTLPVGGAVLALAALPGRRPRAQREAAAVAPGRPAHADRRARPRRHPRAVAGARTCPRRGGTAAWIAAGGGHGLLRNARRCAPPAPSCSPAAAPTSWWCSAPCCWPRACPPRCF